jgi:hypothetical protein
VPELTPDPVFDKLALFSPDPAGVDAADILFRAGRASAPTPWGWKAAVAVLGLTTAAAAGWAAFGRRDDPPPPVVVPVPVAVPVLVPAPEPAPVPYPERPPGPWSLGALIRTTDVNELPRPEPVGVALPADPPLAAFSARRGEID